MDVKSFNEARSAVRHFTLEMTDDYCYGWTWNQVVNEYLRTGYNAEVDQFDIVVMGITYKILKRREVTAFYDAAGNTLFDVTHERLKKEYEWLVTSGAGDVDGKDNPAVEHEEIDPEASEMPPEEADPEITNMEEGKKDVAEGEKESSSPDQVGEDDNVILMGKASLKEIITGLPEPTVEENEAAKDENAKPVKQSAKEKLEKERESAKDSTFAEPIIEYLLKRCNEDEGMAEDVVQEHKTWQKCFDYIYSQARTHAKGNCAAVRDDVVYEWAEDYYHKDDKAEDEKKAKKAAEDKAKKATADSAKKTKSAAERKAVRDKNTTDKAEKVPAPSKAEAPKEPLKPKRNGKEMDGQLDMFSMMGM